MKSYFCSQQEQVTAVIQAGQWPDGCEPELRAHVEACQACSDLVLVAQAFQQAGKTSLPMAHQLPSPGVIWWRAQIRKRNEAMERVIRPVAIAEWIAISVLLLAMAALIAWQHASMTNWLSSIWPSFSGFTELPSVLTWGAGTLVILVGFAVYLLKAKD